MATDTSSLLFLIGGVLFGFFAKMLWLSAVFFIVLALFVLSSKEAPHAKAAPAGPKIRPVIIRRRYVGPESIYPAKMNIRMRPDWKDPTIFEVSTDTLGKATGAILNRVRKMMG